MPTSDEVRSAGETLREHGRAAVQDARKPLLAVVGAGDLAVSGLRAQLRDLPAGTQAVRRLSSRAGELAERVRDLDPAAVRASMGSYLAQARQVYESLARRGEQVMARRTPQTHAAPAPLTSGADTATDPGAAPDTPGTAADAEPGAAAPDDRD